MFCRFMLACIISYGAAFARMDFRQWWDGGGASGDWLGWRPRVEDRGLTLGGRWGGTLLGVVDGGIERGWTFEEELVITARVDAALATGWEALEGLTFFGEVRWRDGRNANDEAGASPVFNPALYQSGKGWRLMPFGLRWVCGRREGGEGILELEGGWVNPYTVFLQQPGSKLFRNNMIHSSKGITANGVGWSSSYAAWGGSLKVRPARDVYAIGGLAMAVPDGAATSNRGLDFEGAHPPGANGLFAMGEAGWLPSPGGLPGKYVFGGYYWGLEADTFGGGVRDGRWGLYWQADQVLWREPAAAASGGRPAAQQGLSLVSYVFFAPPAGNAMPFYFHAGAIYRGLVPGRDADESGAAFAFGEYSHDLARSEAGQAVFPVHDCEGVLEFDHRFRVNAWSFVQPFVQYLINPGGRHAVPNATVVGLHVGIVF